MRKRISRTIELGVAREAAYAAWTDFERLPAIVDSVVGVTVVDPQRLRWELRIGGVDWEYDALITENIPDRLLVWATTGGEVSLAGWATFESITQASSRMVVSIEWTPGDILERLASLLRADSRELRRALANFKAHIEADAPPPSVGGVAWAGPPSPTTAAARE